MNIWFAIPSIRPLAELEPRLARWKALGYRIALLRQGELSAWADLQIPTDVYLGWAQSVNLLAQRILAEDAAAQWIVTGGDDYEPAPEARAEAIAAECAQHFGGTFGVMQPTGDRWGEVNGSAIIDRIAGSPWLGREWCARAYEGAGPMTAAYFHNYADEELQIVAQREGVFWQRRDLLQRHEHWARARMDQRDRPEWATYINGQEYHEASRTFQQRRAGGFPGSRPLRMKAA